MAWWECKVTINGKDYNAHKQSNVISVNGKHKLKAEDSIKVDGSDAVALVVTDVANRGETLLIEIKETKDVKSQKGSNRNKSSG